MTNFEWLKSLSAEELAEWFHNEGFLMKCPKHVPQEWKENKCSYLPDCDDKCTLMWLQEEHEEMDERKDYDEQRQSESDEQ